MTKQFYETLILLRLKQTLARTGVSRSTTYANIKDGTFVPPARIGPRAVGWPAHAVDAINLARIAGKTKDEIRKLVTQLVLARMTADAVK